VSEAPFKAGDRVRMKARFRPAFVYHRSLTGVVKAAGETLGLPNGGAHQNLRIHRDGLSRPDAWGSGMWERVPVTDLTLDQTAQQLADAVKAGDVTAAMLLADRVVELCGGTPRVV
jgi:hypothetical protein